METNMAMLFTLRSNHMKLIKEDILTLHKFEVKGGAV
jgi:hypothetical protein